MTKPVVEVVKVGKRGEIVLPRRIRSSLGLREGDELMMSVDEKRLILERRSRGFSAYLDAMGKGGPQEEPPQPRRGRRERRGLARFLPR
jgi:AbrB family looped-hinge helix DNA binding protein